MYLFLDLPAYSLFSNSPYWHLAFIMQSSMNHFYNAVGHHTYNVDCNLNIHSSFVVTYLCTDNKICIFQQLSFQ